MWIPNAEQVIIPGCEGLSFIDITPWRILLHTTEGHSIGDAVNVYKQKKCPPHLTVDPRTQQIAQHVPLDYGSYALLNVRGGVETNRTRCIQIEIVYFAAETPDMPDEELDWLGAEVIAPIVKHTGCELKTSVEFQDRPRTLPILTDEEWMNYSGFLGHQHAPENRDVHWDPGAINIYRIMRAAALRLLPPLPPTPPTQTKPSPQEFVDMKVLKVTDDPAHALLLMSSKGIKWINSGYDAEAALNHMTIEPTTTIEAKRLVSLLGAYGPSPDTGSLYLAW